MIDVHEEYAKAVVKAVEALIEAWAGRTAPLTASERRAQTAARKALLLALTASARQTSRF